MKKTHTDWSKEFVSFAKSGLSQPQYCKANGLKYTTFRYHWERRSKKSNNDVLVEISSPEVKEDLTSEPEFLTLKIDSSGKARLQVNLQFSLGIWS
ncbi:IS66 family insertion sequence element accessory protein TnpA [Leptospira interrogans serovar Szwajizak]|uniref:IS66 family insertion sequence element accessory protein TnpA n=1 Tax=Leptospira interrogans TaxID=173 RepID=UPI00034920C6|nr:hypothetical protein [Leptospira interrogans]